MNTTNPYAPPQAAVQDVTDPRTAVAAPAGVPAWARAILDGLIFIAVMYVPLVISRQERAAIRCL